MMLKRWTRSVALLLAVLFCLSGCSKAEKVDYDTNPLSFETVFDDTLGNPDKPDTADSELCRYEPPAYRIRIYHFRENTIAKGAFYLLPLEYGHPLEDTPPEEGIIKGVFTYDYTKQGNGLRIHRLTLSYETAENITVRNTQIYGKGLQPVSFEGNEFATDLRLTRSVPSNNSGLWFSGDFEYNGEEYSFKISL